MALLIMTAGCKSSATGDLAKPTIDPLADQSFLNQQPCASPCWYGLEPDKSSAKEVHDVMKKLPFLDPDAIEEWPTSWLDDYNAKAVSASCVHPKEGECAVGAIISQDRLKRLTLSPPYGLTFQKAVAVLNSPEYVYHRPSNPEGKGCVIEIIWPQQGIILSSIDLKSEDQCEKIGKSGKVSPDIAVTQIIYITRDALQREPDYVPWSGFARQ
jgi:hypothetical protein